MSALNYERCPKDTHSLVNATIGKNPENQEPIELNLQGVSSVVAIQSAILTLSTAMKVGSETDFLEKVALAVFGKLTHDPHALCPLFTICTYCLLMLREEAEVAFDADGNVLIGSPDGETMGTHECIFDYTIETEGEEEDDDEPDETPPGGNAVDGGGLNPEAKE